MDLAQVAGLLLVVAGIAWMFLIQFWSGRERGGARGEEESGPLALIKGLLDWASENLPRKFLPGVFLIVAGIVVFVLA
jgi:hypothetical protein